LFTLSTSALFSINFAEWACFEPVEWACPEFNRRSIMGYMEENKFPKVGIGVIVINREGKVLIGKRIGAHARKYSIPGGHLDYGETFESAAIRELKEETDFDASRRGIQCYLEGLFYKKFE